LARFVYQLDPAFGVEEVEAICAQSFVRLVARQRERNGALPLRLLLYLVTLHETHACRQVWAQTGSAGPRPTQEEGPLGVAPAAALADAADGVGLRLLLDQAGGACRDIVELAFFGELDHRDLALVFGLTEELVEQRLMTCLNRVETLGRRSERPTDSAGSATAPALGYVLESDLPLADLLTRCAQARRERAPVFIASAPLHRQVLAELESVYGRRPGLGSWVGWLPGSPRLQLGIAGAGALALIAAASAWYWEAPQPEKSSSTPVAAEQPPAPVFGPAFGSQSGGEPEARTESENARDPGPAGHAPETAADRPPGASGPLDTEPRVEKTDPVEAGQRANSPTVVSSDPPNPGGTLAPQPASAGTTPDKTAPDTARREAEGKDAPPASANDRDAEARRSKLSLFSLTVNLNFGAKPAEQTPKPPNRDGGKEENAIAAAAGTQSVEGQPDSISREPVREGTAPEAAQTGGAGDVLRDAVGTPLRVGWSATEPWEPDRPDTGFGSVNPWGARVEREDGVGQRFLAATADGHGLGSGNAPPLPEVLRDFRLRPSSGWGELVDADGSVYSFVFPPTPEWVGTEAFSAGPAPGQEAEPRNGNSDDPAAQIEALSFKAAGLNRSTGQWVVVDGLIRVEGAGGAGAATDAGPWWDRLRPGSRLRGEVRLGSRVRFPLLAGGVTHGSGTPLEVVGTTGPR
jgi:DNA-directed RNA polymerase specialized sigma24 family protein